VISALMLVAMHAEKPGERRTERGTSVELQGGVEVEK
jgi:hypothetical protein